MWSPGAYRKSEVISEQALFAHWVHELTLIEQSVNTCRSAGLVGTAYTAVFIIASAANTGLQGKAFYLGPKSLQNYFLGTNVSTSLKRAALQDTHIDQGATLTLCSEPDKIMFALCRSLRMHGAGIP